MSKILETIKIVIDQASLVSIDGERAVQYAKGFEHGATRHWLSAAPFDFSVFNDEEKLHFVFLFNALSFCYWGSPKWTIEYNGQTYDGAWAMIIALGRAIKAGVPLTDPAFCEQMSQKDLTKVLKGNVEIPLFEERLRIIREIGAGAKQYTFGEIIKSAGGDAGHLLNLILERFPSFNDESTYLGSSVYFEKRAQLLVSDIFNIFNGKGYGKLNHIDQLTACADYKLPQILRKLGILKYDARLAERIDKKNEVEHGSREEVEIRASTIHAVELIKAEVRRRTAAMTSIEINDHLWLMTQEKFPDDKPYHRTKTTAY